jgi:sigma-E factor negative regulatory protein RseA
MKQASNSEMARVSAERVSVLVDGEMTQAEAEAAIRAVCADPSLRNIWHELHLAGDALRSHEVAACDAEGFCARVAAAIASEPTILAPRAMRSSRDSRRYWISGMAVAASIALIGFGAVPLLRSPETTVVANSGPPVEVSAQIALPTIVTARGSNPAITRYLAAHRELGGGTVVPGAAVYLRSEDR